MFLKEKIKIWVSQVFRKLKYHFLFWNGALFFYLFITGNDTLFSNYFGLLHVDVVYGNIIYLATGITLLFSFIDMFFSDRMMRYSPIRNVVFLRSLLYLGLGYGIIFMAANKGIKAIELVDYKGLLERAPAFNMDWLRFLVYFYLVCIINSLFKEIYRKIGVGVFFDWFLGRLNKPREEVRIFMFIDMKKSTTIAESLGHKKFSHLVQDVFNDMAMVDNYHGDIYQYLGDGAIVSWDVKKGTKNNNCIKSFFAFLRVIERRSRYYNWKYGEVPAFKAGLHIGKTMVLQVGNVRRDISYNGDTINTTARIESMCNAYKQDLLISGVLYESLDNQDEFSFKEIDKIKLKGKRRGVQIYQVKQKASR